MYSVIISFLLLSFLLFSFCFLCKAILLTAEIPALSMLDCKKRASHSRITLTALPAFRKRLFCSLCLCLFFYLSATFPYHLAMSLFMWIYLQYRINNSGTLRSNSRRLSSVVSVDRLKLSITAWIIEKFIQLITFVIFDFLV